jgi:hypothetical protein
METYAERLKKEGKSTMIETQESELTETPDEFKKRLEKVMGPTITTVREESDRNVEEVVQQLRWRAEKGLLKYGVTTERKDLSTIEWLQHLQEELMDASVYIEKLKNEIKKED